MLLVTFWSWRQGWLYCAVAMLICKIDPSPIPHSVNGILIVPYDSMINEILHEIFFSFFIRYFMVIYCPNTSAQKKKRCETGIISGQKQRLGMRPLPTSLKGDGRPVFPALQKFGEAVGRLGRLGKFTVWRLGCSGLPPGSECAVNGLGLWVQKQYIYIYIFIHIDYVNLCNILHI